MIFFKRMFLALVSMSMAAGAAAQVVVPVMVQDSSGADVHGLQASDFGLSCKKTTVQSVEEVAPVTVDGFSDSTPVFIVYDAESLSELNQKQMNSLLLSFLRTEETQHHAVTLLRNTHTGLELINNFSSRPDVVLAALDRVSPEKGSVPPTAAAGTDPELAKQVDEEVRRLRQLTEVVPQAARIAPGTISLDERMASLQTVARSLKGSPHRKLLLWVTGYLPVYIDDGVVKGASGMQMFDPKWNASRGCQGEAECGEARYANAGLRVTTPAWAGMLKALNDSRISVSTAYVNGNPGDITDCCVRLLDSGRAGGLENLARGTGGKQLSATSLLNFATLVERLRQEVATYYLLTLKTSASDNRWTSCSVTVEKPKVKVEAPDGFFSVQ
jgi:VWFA-related protein